LDIGALCPKIESSGFTLLWFYFWFDGIYPRRRFMYYISSPTTAAEKLYCGQQEGGRKAVERVFGVLFKRFKILDRPCQLHHIEDMENTLRCCAILHNMMCAYWRSNYSGSRANQVRDEQAVTDPLTDEGIVARLTRRPESEAEPHAFKGAHFEVIEGSAQHFELSEPLVKYQWSRSGGAGPEASSAVTRDLRPQLALLNTLPTSNLLLPTAKCRTT
jgi:Plant transposon protein